MKDKLFDTEEKRESAIAAFQNLLEHPGWKLIEQISDENIEALKDQLETEIEEETLEDVRILRNNLKLTREFRNTPSAQIAMLRRYEDEEVDPDPFPTKESLAKQRA